eukprot:m51a1_g10054 hypothetical protein (1648) ;mRNA; r:55135-60381
MKRAREASDCAAAQGAGSEGSARSGVSGVSGSPESKRRALAPSAPAPAPTAAAPAAANAADAPAETITIDSDSDAGAATAASASASASSSAAAPRQAQAAGGGGGRWESAGEDERVRARCARLEGLVGYLVAQARHLGGQLRRARETIDELREEAHYGHHWGAPHYFDDDDSDEDEDEDDEGEGEGAEDSAGESEGGDEGAAGHHAGAAAAATALISAADAEAAQWPRVTGEVPQGNAVEDLEAEWARAEERVARASLRSEVQQQTAYDDACALVRRLAMAGRVSQALSLVRLLRLVAQKKPPLYDTALCALAVVATWPATPAALREAIATVVALSAHESELAARVLAGGWPQGPQSAVDPSSFDSIAALMRAEVLSFEGRHEEAIKAASYLESPAFVFRFQVRASLWEEAIATVQACLDQASLRGVLREVLVEEYGGGVLPLKFLLPVALPLLRADKDAEFAWWVIKECFTNSHWVAHAEGLRRAVLDARSGESPCWVSKSGVGSLQDLCLAQVAESFQSYDPLDIFALLSSLGPAEDVVVSVCCASVSHYVMTSTASDFVSSGARWLASFDPVTAYAWAHRNFEIYIVTGHADEVVVAGSKMFRISSLLGLRGLEHATWSIVRCTDPSEIRAATLTSYMLASLGAHFGQYAGTAEYRDVVLLLTAVASPGPESLAHILELFAQASEGAAFQAAKALTITWRCCGMAAEELAPVLLASKLFGVAHAVRAQVKLFRCLYERLQDDVESGDERAAAFSALSVRLAVRVVSQPELIADAEQLAKVLDCVIAKSCSAHALHQVAVACSAVLPPDTLFAFVRRALCSLASWESIREPRPGAESYGELLLGHLRSAGAAEAQRKLVSLLTPDSCENNGGVLLYVAERTRGWEGFADCTLECLVQLVLHSDEHRQRALDLIAELSQSTSAEKFANALKRVCAVVPTPDVLDKLRELAKLRFGEAAPADVALVVQARQLSFEPSDALVGAVASSLASGDREALFDEFTADALLCGPPAALRVVAAVLRGNGNTRQARELLLAKRSPENEPLLQELTYELLGVAGVSDLVFTGAVRSPEAPPAPQFAPAEEVTSAVGLLFDKGHAREAFDMALRAATSLHKSDAFVCFALEAAARTPSPSEQVDAVVSRCLGPASAAATLAAVSRKCRELGFADAAVRSALVLLSKIRAKTVHTHELEDMWRQITEATQEYATLAETLGKLLGGRVPPTVVERFSRLLPGTVRDKRSRDALLAAAAETYVRESGGVVRAPDYLVWVVEQQGAEMAACAMAEQCSAWLPRLSCSAAFDVLRALHAVGSKAVVDFCALVLRKSAVDAAWAEGVAWVFRQAILPVEYFAQLICGNAQRLGGDFARYVGALCAEVLAVESPSPEFNAAMLPLAMLVAEGDTNCAAFALAIAKRTQNAGLRKRSALALLADDASVLAEATGLCTPQEIATVLTLRRPKQEAISLMLKLPDAAAWYDTMLSLAKSETYAEQRLVCLVRLEAVFGSLSASQREQWLQLLDSIVWRSYSDFNPAIDTCVANLLHARNPSLSSTHKSISGMREWMQQRLPSGPATYKRIVTALDALYQLHRMARRSLYFAALLCRPLTLRWQHNRENLVGDLCRHILHWQSGRPTITNQIIQRMQAWGIHRLPP